MPQTILNRARRDQGELTLLDGYRILLKDDESNLGWRIVTWLENPTTSDKYVATATEQETNLYDQLGSKERAKNVAFLKLLQALIRGHDIGRAGIAAVEAYLGLPFDQVADELGLSIEDEADGVGEATKTADEYPEIWLTTYNGCKGMSTGFTFVVGLENGVLPRDSDNVTDNEVCQLVVALTRTRKQAHLISTGRFGAMQCKPSKFLKWIPGRCMTHVRVDKRYFS